MIGKSPVAGAKLSARRPAVPVKKFGAEGQTSHPGTDWNGKSMGPKKPKGKTQGNR